MDVRGRKIALHMDVGMAPTQPTIFFVHGNSQSARTFTKQMVGELRSQFRLIAIELPGHGDSGPSVDPERDYAPAGYIAFIQSAARWLDAGPIIYVGHSLGGHLLMQAAEGLPNLAGLLVLGTPPLDSPSDMSGAFLPHPLSNVFFTSSVSKSEVRQLTQTLARSASGQVRAMLYMDFMRTDPRVRIILRDAVLGGGFTKERERLRTLNRPVALVHGTEDPFINGEYLAATSLPNLWRGKVQTIPDAGHCPHLERPDCFNRLLISFAEDCLQRLE
jgi:pimeloyl-ACP methyl ester carboxylesterase